MKVSSHPDSNHKVKWSNCTYVCGRNRTIKYSSNHIPQSEGSDRLSYLPVNVCIYIPLCTPFTQKWYAISTFHCAIADLARMEGVIIVILCDLYCNVFSAVNETWVNLTALLSLCSVWACLCVLEEVWL